MERNRFIKLMDTYGDALVYIRGPVSKKIKYNTVTTELDNPHIQARARGRTPQVIDGRVLTFSWDQNDFRQINPMDVINVVPLSDVVNSGRR